MPDRISPLSLFANPTFRMLWLAALVSNFGGLVQSVGAAWAMAELTPSQAMVALVQTSVTLPIMAFSLVAGVFADNYDRRRVMLVAQVFMMAISVLLAVLAFAGTLSPWMLLGFTFLIGCGTALYNPSWQASMGDIVAREHLPSAVALNSMGFNLMRSVGPAIGGAIVALGGAAVAFAVNAASYITLIAALWHWRAPAPDRHLPREPFRLAFAAGLRYAAMSPNLLRVILRGFLFGLAGIAILALLPLVVRDILQGSAFVYGVMLGCFGLGAMGGALANARLRERYRNEGIVRAAFAVFAAASVVLALSPFTVLTGAALAFAGASWVLTLSLFNVTVQLSTPRWVVGRAMALYQTGTFGGMALGGWLWGAVSQAQGPGAALIWSAVMLLLGVLTGLRAPLPEFDNLNLAPLGVFKEPALRLDLKERSGPIMVMIDYDIAQSDIPEFLRLMAQRRQSRIRDGAQHWTLLRDLENPDLWSETYHVPTWVEYVRHNERRTQPDLEIYQQLQALHCGEGSPRVHRMIERQTVSLRDDMPLIERPTTSALGD